MTHLEQARRASRLGVAAALAAGRLPPRARTPLVLGALALGMPHGAADTELLRVAAAGSRVRQAALVASYAGTAAAGAAVIARGGPVVERAVLLGSAAHFAEGELASWPRSRTRADTVLRFVGAAIATALLPAVVGGAGGAGGSGTGLTTATRSGWSVLRSGGRPARQVAVLAGVAGTAAAGLAARGDREAAGDLALLTTLALATPPAVTFAAYFGGWHALRHTARVADSLVAAGEFPAGTSLPAAGVLLARRSAWAAGVGVVAAGLLAARDPRAAADHALVAVLGLTVPHAATVALRLRRRA